MSNDINLEINQLLETTRSLQLATCNSQSLPEISYTPYIKIQDDYYIFVSELAAHTQNLRDTPLISIMFIEDEIACSNIFARKRLIMECKVKPIDKTEPHWDVVMQEFEQARGNTVKLLKQLPDFFLFQLRPRKGSFIKGFGDAYILSGSGLKESTQIKGKPRNV